MLDCDSYKICFYFYLQITLCKLIIRKQTYNGFCLCTERFIVKYSYFSNNNGILRWNMHGLQVTFDYVSISNSFWFLLMKYKVHYQKDNDCLIKAIKKPQNLKGYILLSSWIITNTINIKKYIFFYDKYEAVIPVFHRIRPKIQFSLSAV